MTWQLVLLVGAIFVTGAVYGVVVNNLAVRYLTMRRARERQQTDRRPVKWNWVGGQSSLRLPSRAECSQVSNRGVDDGLRSLCSELYQN